ncbi:cupin domain-containing protein [Pseudomonas psychrophila]|uniref:cupin domain-containing protein n=1 Tax=Pseudomonas psychrophila TaxID=122355 RepID=UPI0002E541C6|nr:cupin domain-containing protein [Pseudomonas psychrophila]
MTLTNPLKALLLSLACLILFGCTNNPARVEVEQLLKTNQSWDGAPYDPYPSGQPEITVLKIIIPANTALNWHTHPMPNVAYVLSGELFVETRDGKHKITLRAGEVLPEVVQTEHRGTSGSQPVELIVFYAGGVGMPLSQ